MNPDSARAPRENSLKLETLSFDKIPRQSRLFLDFQANSPAVAKFYPNKQTAPGDFAAEVLANYKIDRNKLCDALAEINDSVGAGDKTVENIELLRQPDCLAVVTGQQAGIFSGALYTIYKALSAVKFCEDLNKQNIKAVPVFWIAEEDHDFDEIKKTFIPNKSESPAGALVAVENTPQGRKENSPVGSIDLDGSIKDTIEKLFANLSRTDFTDGLRKLLDETYKPGETFSTAFAKLLARIFADCGLIFLLPLDKKLKELCAPIFAEAVENSNEIVSALLERNGELERENYQAQVLVEENSFPFFFLSESGERLALRRDLETGKIKTQKSKTEFDKEELKTIAQNSPENLSPNALLRPVVQDYLLPTLTYLGGAAEVAYFAQNSVIYSVLNRPLTPIVHRASFTIVEPKHRRTLEKYDLGFAVLFEGKEQIFARIVEKFLNDGTARKFAEAEEIINSQLNNLDQHLNEYEPTLSDNLANRRRKILWHIGALRKKYHRAEIFKNEVARRRIETLFTDLLPDNQLQERTLNVLTFLNLYGGNFIDWVYKAIDTREKNHQILYL
jgi:bacillithiol biosynthesis cysteine-adding enzyme BshC